MAEAEIVQTTLARRIGVQLAVGGVLGFAAWSILGPAVIAWWYEPPVKEMYSCATSVRAAVQQFVIAQLVCATVGATGTLIVVFLARRALSKRAASKISGAGAAGP
jgi:hypothetical protein